MLSECRLVGDEFFMVLLRDGTPHAVSGAQRRIGIFKAAHRCAAPIALIGLV